jgi:hypothetical protein
MNVPVGVGAIRGTYAGEVKLWDRKRPISYVMHASGAGAPGRVRATVTINLEPSGTGTTPTYSAVADAEAGRRHQHEVHAVGLLVEARVDRLGRQQSDTVRLGRRR